MARARNIKPGLFQNELLGEADPIMTLAFIGLWMLADREGRLEDRPKRIRAQLFPYRSDVDMNDVLEWLKVNLFIARYQSNVGPIISIVKWDKHQRPHHKEVDSVLPAQDVESKEKNQEQSNVDPSMDQEQAKNDSSIEVVGQPNPPDTGYLIPDTLNRIPDTGSSDTGATALLKSPSDYLIHLIKVHGYDERYVRTKTQNTTQARQWLDDGITICEVDEAVRASRAAMMKSDGDTSVDPPITYLAKVIASNRQKTAPIKSPSINTHGGFTPDRYAIDNTAKKFKLAGGDS